MKRVLPILVGFLIIPAIPQVRGCMFGWNTFANGNRRRVGAWYGNNWHTILLCSYLAIFAIPSILGLSLYGCELFRDVKNLPSLVIMRFTIVVFFHFQWPLITKPRIFVVAMPPKIVDSRYLPDVDNVTKRIEVLEEISLVFIRITNLGVNTHRNSGILLDFRGLAKAVPCSDPLYKRTLHGKRIS